MIKVILLANKPTSTGRIYPMEILFNIKDEINSRTHYVTTEAPDLISMAVDFTKIAAKIESASIENNDLYINFEYMDTPSGNLAEQLGYKKVWASGSGTVDGCVISSYKFISAVFDTKG